VGEQVILAWCVGAGSGMEGSSGENCSDGSSPMPEAAGEEVLHPRKDVQAGKIPALLSYLVPPFSLLPLFQKRNKFAFFHARQGFILFCIYVAIVVSLLIFSHFPVVGCFFVFADVLVAIAALLLSVLGAISALQGDYKTLPFIGRYAEKLFRPFC